MKKKNKKAPLKSSTKKLNSKSKKISSQSKLKHERSFSILDAYKEMLRARTVDQKSIILYKQNKCHFQIGCDGHEAIGVAAAHALISKKDWFFPYYRDMALCAALGMTNLEFMYNILSKDADPNSGGRQMAMHYGHKDLNIVSQSSPTGTQFLQAVGIAMGIKYSGSDEVVYVSCGEGTTAQGAYHEALNWTAREKLPIIFVVQNNNFAISVHISEHIAGSSVASISSGYNGLDVVEINGLNYSESKKALEKAADRARKGKGGTVVVANVVRLLSHSISDNQSKYRKQKEIEQDLKKDPILILEKEILKKKLITKKQLIELKDTIQREVDEAAILADQSNDPDPSEALTHVLADSYPSNIPDKEHNGEEEFIVDALNHALHEEMKNNEKMIIYGQDVGYGKGGVFSVTTGLTDAFGSNRCFNSPLAEDSIVGTAVGLATYGYKPVVEIQFGDYIWPAMMQLRNELSMMRYRSKDSFSCPAVIRVAVGGYIRGGPYHSQNIEATFSHFPGLVVIYPSNAGDAKALLKSAIRGNDPVLFLEHKGLYRQVFAKSKVGGMDDCAPIGKAKIVREGSNATIITWGALVHRSIVAAQKAHEEFGYDVEVIDIRTISPFDQETVFNSVKKTGRALICHEDMEFMGFGAEIAAQIADNCFGYLDSPVKRIGAKFSIVPQAPVLEQTILPSQDGIYDGLIDLLKY